MVYRLRLLCTCSYLIVVPAACSTRRGLKATAFYAYAKGLYQETRHLWQLIATVNSRWMDGPGRWRNEYVDRQFSIRDHDKKLRFGSPTTSKMCNVNWIERKFETWVKSNVKSISPTTPLSVRSYRYPSPSPSPTCTTWRAHTDRCQSDVQAVAMLGWKHAESSQPDMAFRCKTIPGT